jgi:hypothetical protein
MYLSLKKRPAEEGGSKRRRRTVLYDTALVR